MRFYFSSKKRPPEQGSRRNQSRQEQKNAQLRLMLQQLPGCAEPKATHQLKLLALEAEELGVQSGYLGLLNRLDTSDVYDWRAEEWRRSENVDDPIVLGRLYWLVTTHIDTQILPDLQSSSSPTSSSPDDDDPRYDDDTTSPDDDDDDALNRQIHEAYVKLRLSIFLKMFDDYVSPLARFLFVEVVPQLLAPDKRSENIASGADAFEDHVPAENVANAFEEAFFVCERSDMRAAMAAFRVASVREQCPSADDFDENVVFPKIREEDTVPRFLSLGEVALLAEAIVFHMILKRDPRIQLWTLEVEEASAVGNSDGGSAGVISQDATTASDRENVVGSD